MTTAAVFPLLPKVSKYRIGNG